MTKKRLLLSGLLVILIIGGYIFFNPSPSPFLSEQQLMDDIETTDINFDVAAIEAILPLDERHTYVPFTLGDGSPGAAYYIFTKRAWQLAYLETNNVPMLWQLDQKNTRTNFVVWHFPKGSVDQLEVYLMQDRFYSESFDVRGNTSENQYFPKIQLREVMAASNYGVYQISNEFSDVMYALDRQLQQPSFFSFSSSQQQYAIFINYLKDGEEAYPSFNNGSGYSTGQADIQLDYINYVRHREVE